MITVKPEYIQGLYRKLEEAILDRDHIRSLLNAERLKHQLTLQRAEAAESAITKAVLEAIHTSESKGGEVSVSCSKEDKQRAFWNGYWSCAHNLSHDLIEIISHD